MTRLRAPYEGKLFDGLLDCYVLEDGRHLVSQRGVVRALTNGGRDRGDLGTYLERLPSRFAGLTAAAEVEFSLPGGGVAKGREAMWFVDLLKAYDEADDAGELHPRANPSTTTRNRDGARAGAAVRAHSNVRADLTPSMARSGRFVEVVRGVGLRVRCFSAVLMPIPSSTIRHCPMGCPFGGAS